LGVDVNTSDLDILGFIFAFLIGVTLGTTGAGGAVMTISVLVYVMGFTPTEATSYSLLIVGTTALVGSLDYFRKGNVDVKKGLFFSFPAFVMVLLMRRYVLPVMPDTVFRSSVFTLEKDHMIMLVFAILMIISSYSMIVNKKKAKQLVEKEVNYVFIFLEGIVVGVLTGFVGAGGGFMIIPALVLFAHLPMKKAIGTSLFIITINSAFGVLGDVLAGAEIDLLFFVKFASLTIAGILTGSYLARFIPNDKLKSGFGWFVLVLGAWILVKETFFK